MGMEGMERAEGGRRALVKPQAGWRLSALAAGAAAMLAVVGCGGSSGTPAASTPKPVIIGLITKTDANPFFVKMREGAQSEARAKGAVLVTGAGNASDDAAGQITALENMVSIGAKAILITPVSAGVTAAIKKARSQGVLVIALDSPTDPVDAADALFATDNSVAGKLIGQYAKAAMTGKTVKIAMLDEAPGSTVGKLRHDGFLAGYGIPGTDPQVVCVGNGGGNQPDSQTAMENCLTKDPGINVLYTINEPSAFGAYKALQNRGKQGQVLIVSVDGGCAGVGGVVDGRIAATSQQYPLKMAALGVDAGVDFATTGKRVSGYTDTGVTLITDKPQTGVDSKDTKFGLANCWG
jgi:fructose transport system substrate-binding protein